MILPINLDLTPIPEDFREITWDIGTAELQKSVMAAETFELLAAGKTNVEGIRTEIRIRRKLKVNLSTGHWTKTASDRFVNEHAWVLSAMTRLGMISAVSRSTKVTSLLPGAAEKLPDLVEYFRSTEPFIWSKGHYKKAPGW
jgi:hypothetical protein